MRERVSLAGGELKIASQDRGTTLMARFGIQRAETPAGTGGKLRLATEQEAG
jgi:signal transduction histidine kinase